MRHLQSTPIELVNESKDLAGKAFQAGYDYAVGQCLTALAAAQQILERTGQKGKEYDLIVDLLWNAPRVPSATPHPTIAEFTELDRLQLQMFVTAAASGRFSEWPHLRVAVAHALAALDIERKRAEVAEGVLRPLLDAAKLAKKHLQPDLVEPGRTVFWALVDPIANAEKLLVAAARAQAGSKGGDSETLHNKSEL